MHMKQSTKYKDDKRSGKLFRLHDNSSQALNGRGVYYILENNKFLCINFNIQRK